MNNKTGAKVDEEPVELEIVSSTSSNDNDEISGVNDRQGCSISKKKIMKKSRKKLKFNMSWLTTTEFKSWLCKSRKMSKSGEQAFCKICRSDIAAHKGVLLKHLKSERHRFKMQQVDTNFKIGELFKVNNIDRSTRRAEVKLCALLASNNLPFVLMDTLSPLMVNIFSDSDIAKSLAVKRTKATVIIEILGKKMAEGLFEKLREPGCFFSLIMDETTDVSVKSQCAFTVNYFDREKNMMNSSFFDIVELEGRTANDLFLTLKNSVISKKIPFSNLVGFASDTTNVLVGEHHSVFALLKKENPFIVCIKCSCHMIHLAASKACLKLPRSVEDLLRNIGSHFSRSSSRQQKLILFQSFFQTEIHKILSPAQTRWLSLKSCVDRILEQYEPLKAYLTETLFEDPSLTTENMLTTMKNEFTKIYLQFMAYVLGLLTQFNTLFQSNMPLLHRVKPETEGLLKTLCANFIKIEQIRKENILTLDHKHPRNFVDLGEIYLGVEATEAILSLKEKPNADQDIEKFFKNILEFYIELVTNIKQRFCFDDRIYEILEILDPTKAQNLAIKSLAHVISRFPFLEEHITSRQDLDSEWRQLAIIDYDQSKIDRDNFAEHWRNIFNLKNSGNIELFPNLKKVVSLLLILPFSNASVERVFSHLFNIKTDKRNALNTSTLNALLSAREGVQREGGILKFEPNNDVLNTNIWQSK